jgi:molybdenum cofactor biosynthesis enzyme MoaA
MTVEKAEKAMEAGLGVLKFSLDAMDERKIKKITKVIWKSDVLLMRFLVKLIVKKKLV